MKHILSLCMVLSVCTGIYAQHTIQIAVKDKKEKKPLAGTTARIAALKKKDDIRQPGTGIVQQYSGR